MRRRLFVYVCLLALVAATPVFATGSKNSWAQAEIKLVTSRGLMGGSAANFRPMAPLTQAALRDLIAGLTGSQPTAVASPAGPVTVAELDAKLVHGLDLSASARAFSHGARAAGLRPPARFGTEVVARLLGLRKNHPASNDDLELLPGDPATRAEAAYSAARVLRLSEVETERVTREAEEFELPTLSSWQRRILETAFGRIGFPYVWGGTSDGRQTLFGVRSRGGFDCSGFVWRVYRVPAYAGGEALARTVRGRTAAAMAGEAPKARRITFSKLAPGDLLFFGQGGPRARPEQIDHAGIYAGNGWMIHSSRHGVALAKLEHWYRDRFAWGRRPLAEAGLT